jgi:hypothetical protein
VASASETGPPRPGGVGATAGGPRRVRPRRRLAILVVGTDDWAADQSAAVLETAGHRVLRCHELGEPAFPCNALISGRTCPLDARFDVVLTARARPTPAPAPGETGVICALHDSAPLVTSGISENNPFAPWAAVTVGKDGDLAEACEAAAATRVFDLRRTVEQ